MNKPHFVVNDAVRSLEFKARQGRDNFQRIPKDRDEQARKLKMMYADSIKSAGTNRSSLHIDSRYKSSGSYIAMEVDGRNINMDSLNVSRGVKLMNIKQGDTDSDRITATLFLPDKHLNWLDKKLEKYSNPDKDRVSDNDTTPSNARLINSIERIAPSSILDLFTNIEDKDKYEQYSKDYTVCCEMWINHEGEDFNLADVFGRLDALCIEHGKKSCNFVGVTVVLVKGVKDKLDKLPFAIDNLSELRLFKQASVLTSASLTEQGDWVNLIKSCTETLEAKARVGIIDSGVNNTHPLLSPFLPIARCHNAVGVGLSDRMNHGTLLAGLALYGDLTDVIYKPGPIIVNTDLSSVKILSGRDETPNDVELYGAIMEEAICTARNEKAYVQCSAVTACEGNTAGEPSSWSSAIDEALFNGGDADTLLFISAGNVEETNGEAYPDFNVLAEVKDPAQSWNAVTVGAYTEKNFIEDTKFDGINVVATKGGLSPYSSTSMMWSVGLVKPEILMEGGNAIDDNGRLSNAPDEINLISTCALHNVGKYFDAICATSAATALATRLAAKIQAEYPQLTALSIRALMIHSAEWTDVMKNMFRDEGGNLDIRTLLHTCGYGVPVEKKALASSDCYVTFVSEQILIPLVLGSSGEYKLNAMHLFDLPWPKDVLEQMGEEEVTLKITLSYYIQPAPGSKTRQNKYKYPSLRLRFDVNKPTETEEQFIRRVSHVETEGVEQSTNDTKRWGIGIQERNNGSVISDYIVSSAADIASCNKIAVFPASGWWQYRKYTEDRAIKYSLVVSVETRETEIYNSITRQIAVAV